MAVIGHLGEIERELEELGGNHSHKIKHDGKEHSGYIFNKSKSNEVIDVLIDYAKQDEVSSLNSSFVNSLRSSTLCFPSSISLTIRSINQSCLSG